MADEFHWQPYHPSFAKHATAFEIKCMLCEYNQFYCADDFVRMLQFARADGWRVNYTKQQYRYECPKCCASNHARLAAALAAAKLEGFQFKPKPKKKKEKKK